MIGTYIKVIEQEEVQEDSVTITWEGQGQGQYHSHSIEDVRSGDQVWMDAEVSKDRLALTLKGLKEWMPPMIKVKVLYYCEEELWTDS